MLRSLVLASTLLLASVALAQTPDRREIANQPADLQLLRDDRRTDWTVRSVPVEELGALDLDVREADVFDRASRLVVSDGAGERDVPRPSTRYFRGSISTVDGSVVAITVTSDGEVTGLMTDGSRTWQLRQRQTDQTLEAVVVDAKRAGPGQPFQCGNDRLVEPPAMAAARLSALDPPPAPALPEGQYYRVTVAIDTDYEFYQLMGSSTATASNYIGSLFNYISGIYELETQTRLAVGDVFLWTTISDPWTETSGTYCRLAEFGRYWRNNRSGVYRTLAHFLSGRGLGGGIAWINTLCAAPTTYNQATGCASVGNDLVAGGFGVSANLTGVIQNAAGIAWDAVVVAHEIGHNFSSPHTHCYGGIGGNSSPVDACYNAEKGSACWAGSTSLPGIDSLTGGTSNGRNGTIMSYCHQQSGGIGNVAGTFGFGHPFGIQAGRVSTQMFNRVAVVAGSNSACIPVISTDPILTVSRVGNGTVTSSPPGIDCGSTCSASFATGANVTLTAAAAAGSVFAGWSGACTGAGTCMVAMTASRTATATFAQSLSNGQQLGNLSGAVGSAQHFAIVVPGGATNLLFQSSGGTGNADLYVRFGSAPTLTEFSCRSNSGGNGESCSFPAPTAGTYFVMLSGFSSYSGVSLRATFDAAPTNLFRAYLSSSGSDSNPCTLQAPCRLLPAALNAVASGGEIWMLNSANYNTATFNVNKSVSIMAMPGAVGSVMAIGGPAINITSAGLNVALRNLVIAPLAGSGGTSGIVMTGDSTLTVEDSLVANLPQNGIEVAGAGVLKVANSTLRNNAGAAFSLAGGSTAISFTQMLANGNGVVATLLAAIAASAAISDSVISDGLYGVRASTAAAGASARIQVTRSTIERTQRALQSDTNGNGIASVVVSGSTIVHNSYAWYRDGTGTTISSLGDNHFTDNASSFGALTATAPQ